MDKDIYQDIRVNGETVYHGRRNCETRWQVLKPFMERFRHHPTFRVLDFGANYGYFSWRIHEDYPQAHITTVDSRPILKVLYKINKPDNMVQLDNMDTDMLREHAENNQYDVILLMSILHHFDNYEEILEIFQSMSDHIIIEADYPHKPNFKHNEKEIHTHLMSKNITQLNKWITHDRPIYHLNDNEISMKGIVASGSGLAKQSVTIINKLFNWVGESMYPGTLNLGIDRPLYFNWRVYLDAYVICEMYLNGLPVLMIRDTTRPYDPARLELMSPYYLRDYFDLNDHSPVVVSVDKRNEYDGELPEGWRW